MPVNELETSDSGKAGSRKCNSNDIERKIKDARA
jgi:hypothetical protein